MLASIAGYNILSYINNNVYLLVVNSCKYFTNQDVWANMPIFSNSFFIIFRTGNFIFEFSELAISMVKKCQFVPLVLNKKHVANMQKKFLPRGHLFLMCSVLC